ncbi:ABC transporter [Ceratobasidium sp. AG-Ba]|nr:ABC transporter [Ceratobasidium sp. AG-Ba]
MIPFEANLEPIVSQIDWLWRVGSELSLCENDYTLGPYASCRAWDFTIGFERTILTAVPDLVFVLGALLRIWYLFGQSSKLKRLSYAQCAAKSISSIFLILSSASLALTSHQLRTMLPSPRNFNYLSTIPLVSSLLLTVLVGLEHVRSLTPSTLVLGYGIFKALASLVILRTYAMIGLPTEFGEDPLYALTQAAAIAYGLVVVAEAIEKRRLVKSPYNNYPRECFTSVLTRHLYLWLVPLLWRGSKVKLGLEDLQDFPPDYSAAASRARLEDALAKNRSLFWATMSAYGGAFFAPVVPRLVLTLATFSQPFLVEGILTYVQSDDPAPGQGQALVLGFFVAYGVIVYATAVYWEKTFDLIVAYRGALVGSILHKSLTLAAHEGRIGSAMSLFHEVWGSILAVGLGIAILYSKTGWAAFIPLLVVCLCTGLTSYCSNILRRTQSTLLDFTDKRMKLIGSTLLNLLPIKMSAYEDLFIKKIREVRNSELLWASKYYVMVGVNVAVSNSAPTFCTVSVLSAYALMVQHDPSIGKLDTTMMFTIFSTVQLLGAPLVGQVLPALFGGWASFKRVETFLNMTDKPKMATDNTLTHNPNLCDYDFKITHGNFAWEPKGPTILKSIDFTLKTGRLYMCVGPVASGKTSLMASLLGETTLLDGSLVTSPKRPKVGYAAQDAFIFTGTVRENILLGTEINAERYQAVVAGCGLEPDLARFPAGDLTRLVGGGTNLSGGQKQRIALARSLYSDAPVLFLDDPLSALDATTEEHVARTLFGESTLLKERTVFIATHGVHHLPSADTVIVMSEGSIVFQGTYSALQNEPGLLHLAQEPSRPQTSTEIANTNTEKLSEKIPQEQGDEELDDEAKTSYNQKGWHPYQFWTQMAGTYRVARSLLVCILWMALAAMISLYIKAWSEHQGHVASWIVGYCVLSVVYSVVGTVAWVYWGSRTCVVASANIHERQVEAVIFAPSSYLQATPLSRLVNRFSQDVSAVLMSLPSPFIGMFLTAVSLSFHLTFILLATPWLAAILPFLASVYWFLLKFYLATSTQLQQLESASISPLLASFGTIISGLETVRSFNAQKTFGDRSDAHLNSSQGPLYFRYAGMRFLRTVLSFATMLIAVGVASLAVGLRSSISTGLLGIALSSLTRIAMFLAQLLMLWGDVENSAVAVERLYEITTIEPEPDLGKSNGSSPRDVWPTHGRISFEGYTMSYAKGQAPALRDLTFSIPGGSTVGICGRTGSGKSSTVNALFRTVESELVNGTILIDDIDIKDLPLKSLRSALSIVPQDPFLWHASIRENLDLEGVNSDAEIWQALDRVGVREAIARLENQLDTVLQDGVALSRGQRQLLCMARVLLRKRKIVILDEATSSMDPQTDRKIREIISEELKDCTVLSIAHRIATIINFDTILVLEDGKVVEIGPPQALLADSSSRFFKLANSQGILKSGSQ